MIETDLSYYLGIVVSIMAIFQGISAYRDKQREVREKARDERDKQLNEKLQDVLGHLDQELELFKATMVSRESCDKKHEQLRSEINSVHTCVSTLKGEHAARHGCYSCEK